MDNQPHEESGGSQKTPFFKTENEFYNFYIGIKAGGRLWNSIRDARKSVRIISPFLDETDIDKLRDKLDGSLEFISIITTVPGYKLEEPRAAALCGLIHREKLQGRSGFEYLPRRGFNLVVFKKTFIHTKLYIIDDEIAYSGSLNFTQKGMTKNHETCLTISNRDTVKDLIAYFDWLFRFNPSDQWDFADLGKKLDRFFAQRESL